MRKGKINPFAIINHLMAFSSPFFEKTNAELNVVNLM